MTGHGTCVDAKSAPYAKHTASRTSLLHTRKIPRRASQFSLKINKRQSSKIPKLGTCRVVPDSSIFTARKSSEVTYSYKELSASKLETIRELQSTKRNIAERMM
jgi:hypothetical protein